MAAQAGLALTLGSCLGSGSAAVVCEAVRQKRFLRGLYLPWTVALESCVTLAIVTGAAVVYSFRQVQNSNWPPSSTDLPCPVLFPGPPFAARVCANILAKEKPAPYCCEESIGRINSSAPIR